ncbi:MAG: hypothetical protein S4CHLAM102_12140 [Chlamydiia bacterium]|nr:hypothetical protein [Chlamydiia bacterium]
MRVQTPTKHLLLHIFCLFTFALWLAFAFFHLLLISLHRLLLAFTSTCTRPSAIVFWLAWRWSHLILMACAVTWAPAIIWLATLIAHVHVF